ncbi:hypothetical protein ACFQHW_01105 [Lapidilactobacillus achengensis]|uniref:Alpha-galactosidase n=1 Tax=Lapidilactobacillus achengensis TaxID=2486000 RepID=A0ABW1ULD2_9LACO
MSTFPVRNSSPSRLRSRATPTQTRNQAPVRTVTGKKYQKKLSQQS